MDSDGLHLAIACHCCKAMNIARVSRAFIGFISFLAYFHVVFQVAMFIIAIISETQITSK
jgi:hypothetical protein